MSKEASTRHLSISSQGSLQSGQIYTNKRGLGWFVAGLFVIADLAGGGLVALPTAMIQSSFYFGLFLACLMSVMMGYTAHLLGKCWSLMVCRWPEYRTHCRNPYAEMGYRALGPHMRYLVSASLNITQFGAACVYLLLSSKNIHDFLRVFFDTSLSFCVTILLVATALLPLMFLKSPNDFWWAVVVAMLTSVFAVIMIVSGSAIDIGSCRESHHMPSFSITNCFLAMGTFLFSYGGHSAFPTIQHDMKIPGDFTKSAIFAFGLLFCLYTPIEIIGYVTYGDSLKSSIINSIQTVWIQQAINVFITIHCILTITIIMNPLNQETEKLFNIPHHFGWHRVLVRTGLMCAIVFVSETIPNFGPLLDLIGGSTVSMTSVIFPCLFYLYLNAAYEKRKHTGIVTDEVATVKDIVEYTPRPTLVLCVLVIAFGILAGMAATFSAIRGLLSTHFTPPCYLSYVHRVGSSATNCCGKYQNISSLPGVVCAPPDYGFYDH